MTKKNGHPRDRYLDKTLKRGGSGGRNFYSGMEYKSSFLLISHLFFSPFSPPFSFFPSHFYSTSSFCHSANEEQVGSQSGFLGFVGPDLNLPRCASSGKVDRTSGMC